MKRYCVIFTALIIASPLLGLAREMEESANGYVTAPPQNPVERSPLINALHQARADGDMDLFYALEVYILVPTHHGENTNTTTIRRFSGTIIGAGEYDATSAIPKGLSFDKDIDVRPVAHDRREFNQDMVSDSNGALFVVMEDTNDDVNHYAQVYRSDDGGENWTGYWFVLNATSSVETPSLAVGEGATGDVLLLAYIIDDHINPRYPEVATIPLVGGTGFTVQSVPSTAAWDYYKPVIWTDSHSWSGWFAYMTAESVVDAPSNNINAAFWRSTDAGVTWTTPFSVLGNFDAFEWLDPDGSFGTDGNTVFLASYNNTDSTIYALTSDDYGLTFNPEIAVGLMTPVPTHAVDPDIEAAINGNNVMLVFTRGRTGGQDDPGQTYSTDAGATWSNPLWLMDGADPDVAEFSVQLTANEGGGSWHVTWTRADWWIDVSSRPQDLSAFWPETHMRVNEIDWASGSYPKKGIASDWASDRPGVSWSDYRGTGYDTYFAGTIHSLFADGFESGTQSNWN